MALVRNGDLPAVPGFADSIAQKVLGQHIHNPRARRQKFVSVSVGAASLSPTAERVPDMLVQAAMKALERAKHERGGCTAVATPEEINGTAA